MPPNSSINWFGIEFQMVPPYKANMTRWRSPLSGFLRIPSLCTLLVGAGLGAYHNSEAGESGNSFDIVEIERPRIMEKAAKYLREEPVTVTASHCERSAGDKH